MSTLYPIDTTAVDPITQEPVVPAGVTDLLQDENEAQGGGCCGGACCNSN